MTLWPCNPFKLKCLTLSLWTLRPTGTAIRGPVSKVKITDIKQSRMSGVQKQSKAWVICQKGFITASYHQRAIHSHLKGPNWLFLPLNNGKDLCIDKQDFQVHTGPSCPSALLMVTSGISQTISQLGPNPQVRKLHVVYCWNSFPLPCTQR